MLYERFGTESYYFPWEWMLNSCFLVFERGPSGIYFKECFAAFGGGNALLFWFSSHSARVDERIEKKGHWQRWWACTGRIRVFVFNKNVINIRKHAIETSAFWFRLAVNARKSWNVFITRNPSLPLPDRLISTTSKTWSKRARTKFRFSNKKNFRTNFRPSRSYHSLSDPDPPF